MISFSKFKQLQKLTVLAMCLLCLAFPAGSASESQELAISSYTIADAIGDWGYPTPYAHYARGPGYARMQFVFDTLIWKDAHNFIPQLAREWEYIESENAYLFKLQSNVKWHDGANFSAEDVVFTFDYLKNHPFLWVDNSIVRAAVAIDSYTVKLYLNTPYAPFLQDIAGVQPILPRHIWENISQPERFTSPAAVVGSGPFVLADYNKAQGTYLYRAFDDYYLGKPRVNELRFVKINSELIPSALKSGYADAGEVPPELISNLEKAGLAIITAPLAWNAKLTVNHQKAPLWAKKFRQALAYAIDRELLVQITQRTYAIAGSPGLIPPTNDWFNPDTSQYPYNPKKSKQLLEELGYSLEKGYFVKDGKRLELELIAPVSHGFLNGKEVGYFVAQQLEKVGIKVDFRTLEPKTVDAQVNAWNFDLAIYGHGGLYEPSVLNTQIIGEGFTSARYKSNKKLTELIEAQLAEMDRAKRKELVFQIQKMYAEDVPNLTLYYPKWYWAHSGKVELFYTKDGIGMGVPLPLNKAAFLR